MTTQQRLEELLEEEAILSLQIKEALASAGVQSFSLSDNDGNQSETKRDPQALIKARQMIRAEITKLEQSINGGGIVSIQTRFR